MVSSPLSPMSRPSEVVLLEQRKVVVVVVVFVVAVVVGIAVESCRCDEMKRMSLLLTWTMRKSASRSREALPMRMRLMKMVSGVLSSDGEWKMKRLYVLFQKTDRKDEPGQAYRVDYMQWKRTTSTTMKTTTRKRPGMWTTLRREAKNLVNERPTSCHIYVTFYHAHVTQFI